MNDAVLIQISTQLLWVVFLLSLPIVAAVATVSLLIGLLQALTQLQDQSLQFIFKLVTTALMLLVTYRWMGSTMLNYANMAFSHLSRS